MGESGLRQDDSPRLRDAIKAVCDPTRVMQRIVEQAVQLIGGAHGAAVELLVDGELRYVCVAGSLADFVGLRLATTSSLSGLAVTTGITQICGDSEQDPRVDRNACRSVGSRSMVCVPLRRGEVPVGVLKVSAPTVDAFDDRDVAMLGRMARFVTTTITASHELSDAAEDLLDPSGWEGRARVDEVGMSRFVANVIRPGVSETVASDERVRAVLAEHRVAVVLQPVVDMSSGKLVGAEALARFPGDPYRPPDVWFREARRAQLGVELQLEAVRLAVEASAVLPDDAFVAVNVDAEALASPELPSVLFALGNRPLVLELTEHVEINDYPALRQVLDGLRGSGAAIAIDDTGAGYSSFSHILKLAPELIKLDIELVRGVDVDPVRRSLVTAVATFAQETGSKVVAEGIETKGEFTVLRDLAVDYGQGYFLGRPMPPDQLPRWTAQLLAGATV